MITNIKDFSKHIIQEGSAGFGFSDGSSLPTGFTPVNMMWNGKALTGNNTPYDPTISLFGAQRFNNSYFGASQIMQRLATDVFTSYGGASQNKNLEIKDISIIKIAPSLPIGIDVHFKFNLNDNEIWGVVKKFGHQTLQKIICPEIDAAIPPNDLKFTHNRIIAILQNWSKPKQGLYSCIKDLIVYNVNGEQKEIKKGTSFTVVPYDDFGSTCYVQTDFGKFQLRPDDTLIFNVICKEITSL